MERCVAVIRHSAIAGLIALLLLPIMATADRTVVLVTGESCPVEKLDPLDVRKVYLGITVSLNGNHIRPLRFTGDEQLNRIFFQSIVAMSRKSYEKRALSLALRFGTPRPPEISDLDMALGIVRRIDCSIVYAWSDELVGRDGIKILQPLWRGE